MIQNLIQFCTGNQLGARSIRFSTNKEVTYDSNTTTVMLNCSIANDGGKPPIPSSHPSSEKPSMVNPSILLNKETAVEVPMSMSGNIVSLPFGGPRYY